MPFNRTKKKSKPYSLAGGYSLYTQATDCILLAALYQRHESKNVAADGADVVYRKTANRSPWLVFVLVGDPASV